MKLFLAIVLSVLPLSAFANVADTVCDINGLDISFDLGSSTPPDTGSRGFYALTVAKKGHAADADGYQIRGSNAAYRIAFTESNGDFSLRITSKKSHRLVFSAEKKTTAGVVKTDASSSIKGFSFPTATFSCQ
jgi:opacity protein-like surface antigen